MFFAHSVRLYLTTKFPTMGLILKRLHSSVGIQTTGILILLEDFDLPIGFLIYCVGLCCKLFHGFPPQMSLFSITLLWLDAARLEINYIGTL